MFGLFAMHVSDAWSYCVVIHSCVVIPLRWYFFVCQQLCFKVHTHTEKHMRGQRKRQKIVSREGRVSSVFAPRPLAGAPYFWEIRRITWCAQVSLQSVSHRSGCEVRKSVSATRQCHNLPSSVLTSAAGHYACREL